MTHHRTLYVFLLFVLLLGSVMHAKAELVTCMPQPDGSLICKITEPNVRQRLTPYPQVSIQPGDRVTIEAGGCVNTGGLGKTWKRYVDPLGDDSDRLYHGLIWVPGVTNQLVRLQTLVGQTVTVGSGVPISERYLRLGYEDGNRDYGNNGYNSRDNGTSSQCATLGNAYVILTIVRPSGPISCAGSTGNGPLDLAWTNCDPNGLPMNARWKYEVTTGSAPDPRNVCQLNGLGSLFSTCTSGITLTRDFAPAWTLSGSLCKGPHVNFIPATYQGRIDWENKSDWYADGDYNWRLFTPGRAIATNDIVGPEIEHSSDETIDNFRSWWWAGFHNIVDRDNSAAQAAVKSRFAIVSGLLGLDCGHPSCNSELHPAYAMAINVDGSDPRTNDLWAMFARNWGNEGYCSSDQHYLPMSSFKILIPWRVGAIDVRQGGKTKWNEWGEDLKRYPLGPPQVTIVRYQGVLVEFPLATPQAQMGIEGQLQLIWTFGPEGLRTRDGESLFMTAQPIPPEDFEHRTLAGEDNSDPPEKKVGDLIEKLPERDRSALRPLWHGHHRRSKPLRVRPMVEVSNLPYPRKPLLLRPRSVPDKHQTKRHQLTRALLCREFNNSVPGFESICKSVRRVVRAPH